MEACKKAPLRLLTTLGNPSLEAHESDRSTCYNTALVQRFTDCGVTKYGRFPLPFRVQ